MQFSIAMTHCNRTVRVYLRLAGAIRTFESRQLRTLISDLLTDTESAGELVVDLDDVTAVDGTAVSALVAGYATAIEHGTVYRVINARRQVDGVLRELGVADLLADSEDLGALLVATLHLPSAR